MFNKVGTIEEKVMKIVKERIVNAQAEYDAESKTIDTACDEEVAAIESKRVESKEELAAKLAKTVLGEK